MTTVEKTLVLTNPSRLKKIINQYNDTQLLRFTTAGSVDDGKSTLIGRLLYDSKSIFEDQLHSIRMLSQRKGFDYIDLSLLTDGLKSEREQGITIDVAYRYFATPKRKFIIADTPGHIQYTRNMVTGASTANLAIILVDARKGLAEQTCRHAYIASLLRIPHLIVCINKMDLVSYDREVFERIVDDFKKIATKLNIYDIHFIPISALAGDNVVQRSANMSWYSGTPLLERLETIQVQDDYNYIDGRFPVQYVIHQPTSLHIDFKSYAGRIASGIFRVGDKVTLLPSKTVTTIKEIFLGDQSVAEAFPPLSVAFTLDPDIEVKRGNLIVKSENLPSQGHVVEVMLCWMNKRPCVPGARYIIHHLSRTLSGIITEVVCKVDINTFNKIETAGELAMNDIGQVKIEMNDTVFYDSYWRNRVTGSFILIDEETHETVAAAMIV